MAEQIFSQWLTLRKVTIRIDYQENKQAEYGSSFSFVFFIFLINVRVRIKV